MSTEKTFGERLRELRKSKGITQKQLADALMIGRSTIAEYEKGTVSPTAAVIAEIAGFFGVSTDYLLGLTDDPAPKDKEFDLTAYLPNEILLTPKELKKIGQRLIEIAERLERIFGES